MDRVYFVHPTRRGSRGGEMGEFSPPFFWAPSFFCFFLCFKYWNNIWFLWHYYKNSPPISKSWFRPCRPMYRSTYRPLLDRLMANITTEKCRSTHRPMYQPKYRRSQGLHIDRLSADMSVHLAVDTIRWPLIVGRISVDCWWYIGQKLSLPVSDV